jgi:hypothetical protein
MMRVSGFVKALGTVEVESNMTNAERVETA